MESQYQKWVNISYLALAALVGWVIFAFAGKISGTYDLEARIHNIEMIIRILSIAVGALCYFLLYRNEQANQFMNEVVMELSRVTWPTQKETSSATVIVIAMVLVTALFLGFLDFVWTQLVQTVLSV